MNAWVHMGTPLTPGGGRCGHKPGPRCPRRSRGPGQADSLAETDSGCSWPRAAGEPQSESRCRRTSAKKQRERKKREKEEDKEQVQPSPRDGNQREMKNKKEDKQRETGRVTQLGVRGDNGIITLNYNNIHPPDPRPIQSGLRSFRKSCYKMSGRG